MREISKPKTNQMQLHLFLWKMDSQFVARKLSRNFRQFLY